VIKLLHRNKLIFHDRKKYDGYRLTYGGYDHLAIKTLVKRGLITGVGRRIGVGKESDIYEVINDKGERMVLKIHRLGRTSFRAVKSKRDYLIGRQSASWLYMSRLAALREFAYMKALYNHGFPTPVPIDHNRHCILMSLVPAFPFTQVRKLRHPGRVYAKLMNLIVRLAEHGLIHCDFNEFNLMIDRKEQVTMIDFPQMVSTQHRNAEYYFDRDVQCVRTYFSKRFKFHGTEFPVFSIDTSRQVDLDVQLKASGVSAEEHSVFEEMIAGRADNDSKTDDDNDDDDDDDDDEVDKVDETDSDSKHDVVADDDDDDDGGDVLFNEAEPVGDDVDDEDDDDDDDDDEEDDAFGDKEELTSAMAPIAIDDDDDEEEAGFSDVEDDIMAGWLQGNRNKDEDAGMAQDDNNTVEAITAAAEAAAKAAEDAKTSQKKRPLRRRRKKHLVKEEVDESIPANSRNVITDTERAEMAAAVRQRMRRNKGRGFGGRGGKARNRNKDKEKRKLIREAADSY
jgi:RIO kinase 2